MGAIDDILVTMGLDSSKYEAGLKNAEGSANDFSSKVGGILAGIGGFLVAATTLNAVANAIEDCAKKAMEAQDANAMLGAILKSTGDTSGQTMQSLNDQAMAIQKVTRFSDEMVKGGQATLLTMTNIGGKVFPRATQAMVDMAAKTGDVNSAALVLGKVLDAPARNMSLLTRQGIVLSAVQQEQVKHFVAVNDIASAQGIILDVVEKKFGGLAETMGQTTAGQMAIFKNQVGEIQERIGAKLLPVINAVTSSLANWISSPEGQASIDKFVGWIGKVMGDPASHTGLTGIVAYLGEGNIKGAIDTAFGPDAYKSIEDFKKQLDDIHTNYKWFFDWLNSPVPDWANPYKNIPGQNLIPESDVYHPKNKPAPEYFGSTGPSLDMPGLPPAWSKNTNPSQGPLGGSHLPIVEIPKIPDTAIKTWNENWSQIANEPATAMSIAKPTTVQSLSDTATAMTDLASNTAPQFRTIGSDWMGRLADGIGAEKGSLAASIYTTIWDAINGAVNKILGGGGGPPPATHKWPSAPAGTIPGVFASGGQFTVPGVGSGDRPYSVNLTPGEQVTVMPKGKRMSSSGANNIMKFFGPVTLVSGNGNPLNTDFLSQVPI